MSRARGALPIGLAAALAAVGGAGLALILRYGGPSSGIPLVEALAAVVLGVALAVALLVPEAGLVMSLAYATSPISFYILFRNTELGSPYPATSDLALDAAITLSLAGAAALGAALRSWAAGEPVLPTVPARRPLIAIAAILVATAAIGLIAGNPIRPLLADVIPFAELGLLLLLTTRLVDSRRKAEMVVFAVAASLALTAIVRLVLYTRGAGAFGVQPVDLGGTLRPRLYQNYPFGWIMPLALACTLAAPGWRVRLPALGLTLLCGLMVLLSFERGLWVFAAIGTLAVLAFGVRHRPRLTLGLLVGGLAAAVVAGGLLGGRSGFTDPVTLVRDRLASTSTQLEHTRGLQHKRQDEASALWRAIRRSPAGWPLGHGLGSEYVGPTGIHAGDYAQGFQKKHYSFDWYLAMAFRTGAIGLAVALWLLVALGAVGFQAFRRGGSLLARGTGLAVVAGLAGLALVAPIDPYLLAHPLAAIQGATIALVVLVSRPRSAPKSSIT